ncbi:MAG: Hpt domain-containing protein [Polyangiaceae bacterium]
MFRKVHTIKGEARAFDLTELGRSATELEDFLEVLRSRARNLATPPTPDDRQQLGQKLADLVQATEAAALLLIEASPIGPAILEQVTVRRPDLDRVVELARAQGGALYGAVQRLAARPFGEALLYLNEGVPSWGERYGKLLTFEAEGRDVAIPPELMRVLPATLNHLARNAVAHGVETPQERQAGGSQRERRCASKRAEPGTRSRCCSATTAAASTVPRSAQRLAPLARAAATKS